MEYEYLGGRAMNPKDVVYESPLHGYQGDRVPQAQKVLPAGLTLCISREAGARGGTIARKVGDLLGWQVFAQDSIDYLLQQENARQQLETELSIPSQDWLAEQRKRLEGQRWPSEDAKTLVDLLLVIAARGEAVIVGRGAGFLLPPESTIHVRIVAPFPDRVAWLAQLLRLTQQQAEEEVQARDRRRARFLSQVFGQEAADPTRYDAVLNSSRLGVEACAQILGWMVRTRQALTAWASDREALLPDSGLWERPS
jgi:cytidylate kinase